MLQLVLMYQGILLIVPGTKTSMFVNASASMHEYEDGYCMHEYEDGYCMHEYGYKHVRVRRICTNAHNLLLIRVFYLYLLTAVVVCVYTRAYPFISCCIHRTIPVTNVCVRGILSTLPTALALPSFCKLVSQIQDPNKQRALLPPLLWYVRTMHAFVFRAMPASLINWAVAGTMFRPCVTCSSSSSTLSRSKLFQVWVKPLS